MIQIYPLSEGEFTIGRDKQFIPFNLENDILEERAKGSLLVEVQPFLIDAGNELIVVDSGLGFNESGTNELQIIHNIRKLGYEAEDVTMVLLSHLHKDHAGGAVFKKDGNYAPTFPNATYYIYRSEVTFALEKGLPSYIPDEVNPILALENVIWLDGASGVINEHIQYWHTGAHSPQHIVFLMDFNGEKVFYGGDEAPQYKQIKTKYIAKYDFDGRKAMELREGFAQIGKQENWTLLFYHDIKKPISKIDF
jgi:glyoxylase-like metal-dependent hydrolase (beta-lactamase superfamily II)